MKNLIILILLLSTSMLFSQSKRELRKLAQSAQIYAGNQRLDTNINILEMFLTDSFTVKLDKGFCNIEYEKIKEYTILAYTKNGTIHMPTEKSNSVFMFRDCILPQYKLYKKFSIVMTVQINKKEIILYSDDIPINDKTFPINLNYVIPFPTPTYIIDKDLKLTFDSMDIETDSSLSNLRKQKKFVVVSNTDSNAKYTFESLTVFVTHYNSCKVRNINGISTELLIEFLETAIPGDSILFTGIVVKSEFGQKYLNNISFTLGK